MDATEQRKAWERWHDRDDFASCANCPHEVSAAARPDNPTVKRAPVLAGVSEE
jgi:hypothetical protein